MACQLGFLEFDGIYDRAAMVHTDVIDTILQLEHNIIRHRDKMNRALYIESMHLYI